MPESEKNGDVSSKGWAKSAPLVGIGLTDLPKLEQFQQYGKFSTYVTKTRPNWSTYSRKPWKLVINLNDWNLNWLELKKIVLEEVNYEIRSTYIKRVEQKAKKIFYKFEKIKKAGIVRLLLTHA